MSTKGIIARALAGGLAGYAGSKADSIGEMKKTFAAEIVANVQTMRDANLARFRTDLLSAEEQRRYKRDRADTVQDYKTQRTDKLEDIEAQNEEYDRRVDVGYDDWEKKQQWTLDHTTDKYQALMADDGSYIVFNPKTGKIKERSDGGVYGTLTSKDLKDISTEVDKIFDDSFSGSEGIPAINPATQEPYTPAEKMQERSKIYESVINQRLGLLGGTAGPEAEMNIPEHLIRGVTDAMSRVPTEERGRAAEALKAKNPALYNAYMRQGTRGLLPHSRK